MKEYNWSAEEPKGEEGLVNGNPVEVREGSGEGVRVVVGVDVGALCKASSALRI